MNKILHLTFIWSMVAITVFVTVYLAIYGYAYYSAPLEERFYIEGHQWFKPSGVFGHGLGIAGTFMIAFGVGIYIARKRYNVFSFIRLKYLLEFHIFLCTLGPILVLFHTAFKFGGIITVAFWSMVAVVLSGVIGRFIYIQIPKTIEGRALSLQEVRDKKESLAQLLRENYSLDNHMIQMMNQYTSEDEAERKNVSSTKLRRALIASHLSKENLKEVLAFAKEERTLSIRIKRLNKMQELFKYWHIVHLPFALIMLIIVIIHIGVTLAFGYKWIF